MVNGGVPYDRWEREREGVRLSEEDGDGAMKGKETTAAAGRRVENAGHGYRVGLRERIRRVAEIRARGRQRAAEVVAKGVAHPTRVAK